MWQAGLVGCGLPGGARGRAVGGPQLSGPLPGETPGMLSRARAKRKIAFLVFRGATMRVERQAHGTTEGNDKQLLARRRAAHKPVR